MAPDENGQFDFSQSETYRMLGYFCIIGQLRLHALFRDYHLALKVLAPQLMKCIRTTSAWTRKSSKREAKLRRAYAAQVDAMNALIDEAASAHDNHGDGGERLLRFKRFCPTRWLGILQCTIAILTAWPALVAVRKQLVADATHRLRT